jgi:predicted transcriptional regulator
MKKNTCYAIIVLTAGILCFACIPIVHAEMYDVRPAYGLVSESAHDTSKEVMFSELTLRGMIIFIAMSFSPLLVYPVEFCLMLKLFVYLGYQRINELVVFYNNNRRLIYEIIAKNPGINFNSLMSLSGIKQATLKYHLRILAKKEKVIQYYTPESSGYFENNGRYNNIEKNILVYIRNEKTRRILEIISGSPYISRKEIAGIIGVTGSSVTWHTKRLFRGGIITVTRNGRNARYLLTNEASTFFQEGYRKYSGTVPRRMEVAGA